MKTAKKLFEFFKKIFRQSGKDKTGILSAAFAYIAIFSIGPLLLILISTVGFIFGEQAASGRLFASLADIFGADTARAIERVVARTGQSSGGIIALFAGILGMLLAAASLTNQLQNSFNEIFSAVPDPKIGIKRAIYIRLKKVFLLLFGSIFIASSFILSTVIIGVARSTVGFFTIPPVTLELLNNAISLLVFMAILYLVYKVLPDVVIPRRIVIRAAFFVGALFLVGKIVLAIVIGANGTASAYGAAASLVTLLLWFYYTGQILMLGAEGIKVYGQNHSLTYAPKKYTVKRKYRIIHRHK